MNSNYTTLHKDIGLIQRSNKSWDLWFDNGDTVKAEDFNSLQVGIIIACLTSWNYMNRYGNPTYEVFGNRAYELLKANKSGITAYKIQQYFIECLKRMRRVYEVVYLEVFDTPSNPHTYYVEFEVISINNQLVNGSFEVGDSSKSTSYITYTYTQAFSSPCNPMKIDIYLGNEYGMGISGGLIYLTLKTTSEDEVTICGVTDSDGNLQIEYVPNTINPNCTIYFSFLGDSQYNGCSSQDIVFKGTPFCFQLDEDSELYVTTTLNDINNKIFLVEFVESYNDVIGGDIEKYYVIADLTSEDTILVFDTNMNVVFDDIELLDEEISKYDYVCDRIGEIHLFMTDESNEKLYELDTDDHVYYIGTEEQRFEN